LISVRKVADESRKSLRVAIGLPDKVSAQVIPPELLLSSSAIAECQAPPTAKIELIVLGPDCEIAPPGKPLYCIPKGDCKHAINLVRTFIPKDSIIAALWHNIGLRMQQHRQEAKNKEF